MGKFDTILTLGIVAAVGIVGYAVYRNLGKVGSVVTTGVTKSISDPFGNWLDNIIGGTTNGAGSGTGGAPPLNPNAPAFGLLPEAQAPLDTSGLYGITPKEGTSLEAKYGPKAQASAKLILQSFAPESQQQLISVASALAEKSPTPILTQAYSIVDQARLSVGGKEPLLNKFYQLFTLANKPISGGKILPLSKEAVQFYATKGIVAREVYL